MTTILGIDAAWTSEEPSGVALIASDGVGWRCVAVAPSYQAFVGLAAGEPVDWSLPKFLGTDPDVPPLLAAAQSLARSKVDLVAIDMPVAAVAVRGRRAADQAISREFGSRWCSAHTPSPRRPGALGRSLSEALRRAGYPLATAGAAGGRTPCLLEVYPHPALLSLMKRPRRVPYKVSKAGRYWPSRTVPQRVEALLAEHRAIGDALAGAFGPPGIPLPTGNPRPLASLKRYEDALDALVCTWVGVEFLAGRAVALGDDTAAIWVPGDVVSSAGRQAGAGDPAGERARGEPRPGPAEPPDAARRLRRDAG